MDSGDSVSKCPIRGELSFKQMHMNSMNYICSHLKCMKKILWHEDMLMTKCLIAKNRTHTHTHINTQITLKGSPNCVF